MSDCNSSFRRNNILIVIIWSDILHCFVNMYMLGCNSVLVTKIVRSCMQFLSYHSVLVYHTVWHFRLLNTIRIMCPDATRKLLNLFTQLTYSGVRFPSQNLTLIQMATDHAEWCPWRHFLPHTVRHFGRSGKLRFNLLHTSGKCQRARFNVWKLKVRL